MNMLNTCNSFVVQNNNHARYDRFRDKMDTIDYAIIFPNFIANISNVNSDLNIPSDHCTVTVTISSQKLRSKDRNISLKLCHKTDWSRINENIKNKLNNISGMGSKMIEIIHQEIENNIPEIKIKERNTYIPEYIRKKNKRSLRRLYIQARDQNIKPSLN